MPQLTSILYKCRPTYHWKLKYRIGSESRKLGPALIPRVLTEAGVNIVDAAKEQKELEKTIDGYFDWKEDHPMFIPALGTDHPAHPDYKETPCYMFTGATDLLEGLEQAQVLSKTAVYRHPPTLWKQLEPLMASARPHSVPDIDERVRRSIMNAVRWHPSNDKLPKRHSRPGHIYPNYYGITMQKSSLMLMQNLIRLTEMSFCGVPGCSDRRLLKDAVMNVPYERDGLRFVFRCLDNLLLTSNQLLQPFSSEEETIKTKDVELPSIYPMKCNVNLKKIHAYDWKTQYPISREFERGMPHTIFAIHDTDTLTWSLSQKHAKGVMCCHTTLAALARLLFGEDVGDLPRPLSVQCVLSDHGRRYTFYAYQLNTLKVSDPTGIKNQAWIDADHETATVDDEIVTTEKQYVMYTLAQQMEGLHGYQMHKERNGKVPYPMRLLNTYDPVVMNKFLMLYSTQLHTTGETHQLESVAETVLQEAKRTAVA